MAAPSEDLQDQATRILRRMASGESEAAGELFPLVYGELRSLAGRAMAGRDAGHTLQPTALVHEAYVKLVDADAEWTSRHHFLSVAAQAMRSILIDHARAKGTRKRGQGRERVALDEALAWFEERAIDLLSLEEALERLARVDARQARMVELRFFGGLSNEETAAALGVSTPTVVRDWRMARAWLHREIGGDVGDGGAGEGAGDRLGS